jgi:hypothetical protein
LRVAHDAKFPSFFFRVKALSPNKTNKFIPYHLIILKQILCNETFYPIFTPLPHGYHLNLITFSTVKYCNYPLNKSLYLHTLIMTLCCVTSLKPFRFETNIFEKQRKCNKQIIQCFVDEYGVYFTHETGFL